MTRDEWKAEWKKRTSSLVFEHSVPFQIASREAHRRMVRDYGPQPPKEPGPPWWFKLGASVAGVDMKFLDKLNGYKTIIGLVILNIPVMWQMIESILGGAGVDPAKLAGIAGTIGVVIGVLHKAYKLWTGADPGKA